jgi:nucleotide-binding universal stress UspA family protein
MNTNTSTKLAFQNILHLTDFSPCSAEALSWAISMVRAQGGMLFVLNVVIPDTLVYLAPGSPAVAFDMQHEWAQGEMKRIEEQITAIPHQVAIERGRDLWRVVDAKLKEWQIDLIVLGTHGRTGLRRALMGSAAERVLRNSPVPVMTVGPDVPAGETHDCQFHKVLLATDFAAGSAETANYAVSFAKNHRAELTMVHVCRRNKRGGAEQPWDLSIAEAMHRLHELVPGPPVTEDRPDHLVECGEPGPRILDVAKRKDVDLIVMGVRNTSHVFAATHVGNNTAHEVVAHSPCPVLTVRPQAQANF